MNTKHIVISSIAAFAALGAQAFQGELSPLPPQPFQSMQSRADVRAQAVRPVQITNGGTGVLAIQSTTDRAAVRAAAVAATRDGSANYGEISDM